MPTLKEKFHGCIAASWVGSAMGAVSEGMTPETILETFGLLDRLLPYRHYTDVTDWQRPAGTTEDGIERQKLIATAIIEKPGRILAEDLTAVWVRDVHPDKIIYKQERFDRSLLDLARAGVPPSELGRLWPFANVVSMARSSHPIGLVNAGRPQAAADDTFEVGKVYARETSFALRWAALYNAAIAEACKPSATVETVLDAARTFAQYRAEAGTLYALYDSVEREVNRALELARQSDNPEELRRIFYEVYCGGDYFNYGHSQANEVVPKGLAIFAFTRGNPTEAILTAVNFGRDTDCLAAIAGGLAGALSGADDLPTKWVETVDAATREDPYTNNRRSIAETANGIYKAWKAERQRMQAWIDAMSRNDYLEETGP